MSAPVLTRTMDPALKRLLDSLPREDPDKAMATVWIAFCEGRHQVPLNEWTTIDFGDWLGPPMRLKEILVHAAYKGLSGTGSIVEPSEYRIRPHDGLRVSVCIKATPTALIFLAPG